MPESPAPVRIEDQLADVEKDSSKFIMKRCTKIEVGKAQGCDPDVTVVVRCCSHVFQLWRLRKTKFTKHVKWVKQKDISGVMLGKMPI